MMYLETICVRITGTSNNQRRKPIDEVYYSCPQCNKLAYEEGISFLEFIIFVEVPNNSLSCEECEGKGLHSEASKVFRFWFERTYVGEERRVTFARALIEKFYDDDIRQSTRWGDTNVKQ